MCNFGLFCRYPGSVFTDHVLRYQDTPGVKMIVVLGEVRNKSTHADACRFKQLLICYILHLSLPSTDWRHGGVQDLPGYQTGPDHEASGVLVYRHLCHHVLLRGERAGVEGWCISGPIRQLHKDCFLMTFLTHVAPFSFPLRFSSAMQEPVPTRPPRQQWLRTRL